MSCAEEAGRPTSGGGGPGNVEAGSGGGGYALLAAAHAGAAAACFVDPTAVGNFFFAGEMQGTKGCTSKHEWFALVGTRGRAADQMQVARSLVWPGQDDCFPAPPAPPCNTRRHPA